LLIGLLSKKECRTRRYKTRDLRPPAGEYARVLSAGIWSSEYVVWQEVTDMSKHSADCLQTSRECEGTDVGKEVKKSSCDVMLVP
jgi:hypothetical protein